MKDCEHKFVTLEDQGLLGRSATYCDDCGNEIDDLTDGTYLKRIPSLEESAYTTFYTNGRLETLSQPYIRRETE